MFSRLQNEMRYTEFRRVILTVPFHDELNLWIYLITFCPKEQRTSEGWKVPYFGG